MSYNPSATASADRRAVTRIVPDVGVEAAARSAGADLRPVEVLALLDLSAVGASLYAGRELERGERVALTFTPADGGPAVPVAGRVARVRTEPGDAFPAGKVFATGIEFDSPIPGADFGRLAGP